MKNVFTIFFLICTFFCCAQFDRGITVVTAGNLSVPLKGVGVNEAGFGLSIDTHFFSKYRLQALIESSGDYFVGAKEGGDLIFFCGIGPQFFVTKKIAVAVTYGPSWNLVRVNGFKYSISGFRKRFTAKAFVVNTPDSHKHDIQYPGIQYVGIAVGIRIL